jgi:hypothetical protein
LFSENTRFIREKTGQNRSVRKCAKTGQPNACPGIQSPPGDRYGLKIMGFFSAPENRSLFSKKRGDPGADAAGLAPEGRRDLGSTPGCPPVCDQLTTDTPTVRPEVLLTTQPVKEIRD